MELRELIEALDADDILAARQWVKDAMREPIVFATLERPDDLDAAQLAAAAGLAELLASRAGQAPPAWTASVAPSPRQLWLDRALLGIPALRERCLADTPPSLKRRNVYALPDFLAIP